MFLNILILFLVPFIAGMAALGSAKATSGKYINHTLIFSGAYLLAITVIHVLPELYTIAGDKAMQIGIYVLIGFFIQQFLEFLTSGVEHGHMHQINHEHHHSKSSATLVMLGLCMHAFLEGTLLARPSSIHTHDEVGSLLMGIVIHKIPAAIALMSVVLCYMSSKTRMVVFLAIFALASPFGLLLSDLAFEKGLLGSNSMVILFGVVSGNFLYISTTIFFESSPGHRFNVRKLGISLVGVLVAIAFNYFL